MGLHLFSRYLCDQQKSECLKVTKILLLYLGLSSLKAIRLTVLKWRVFKEKTIARSIYNIYRRNNFYNGVEVLTTLHPTCSRFLGSRLNGRWVLMKRGDGICSRILYPGVLSCSTNSTFLGSEAFSLINSFLASSCTNRLNLRNRRVNLHCEVDSKK